MGRGVVGGALLRVEGELRRERLRLRVVAPQASERAALQEDGRPDARTVVEREALDVEDEAGHVGSEGLKVGGSEGQPGMTFDLPTFQPSTANTACAGGSPAGRPGRGLRTGR